MTSKTLKLTNFISQALSRFEIAKIEEPREKLKKIIQHSLNWSLTDYMRLLDEFELSHSQESELTSYIEDLCAHPHKPISKLLGIRGFWKNDFITSHDVLDPRPETELLIELALKHFPPAQHTDIMILELGIGSGALILSLLQEYPSAQGVGIDISQDALEIANKNILKHKLENRLCLIKSDWLDQVELTTYTTKFNIVVANPPYIKSAAITELDLTVQNYDPLLALDGGADGLEPYRKILSQIKPYLAKDHLILFEFGYDQKDQIEKLILAHQGTILEFRKDLQGHDRCVCFHH